MEYFSNSKPDLIVPSIHKTVNKIIKKGANRQTISEKISNNTVQFYKTYISKYKFYILVIICVCAFLIYRYYINKSKKDKELKELKKIKDMKLKLQEPEPIIPNTIDVSDDKILDDKISYESDNVSNDSSQDFQQTYQYDDLYSFN